MLTSQLDKKKSLSIVEALLTRAFTLMEIFKSTAVRSLEATTASELNFFL